MSRREQVVGLVHRIAEVQEQQALVGLGRAEAARREAAAVAAQLEADDAAAEAHLTGSGALGAVERELLWAHRAWVRRERETTGERLALSEAEVAAAKQRLLEKKRVTGMREAAKERVESAARHEREQRAQRELDDIAGQRAHRKP
jgi:hypothetical protein